MKLTKKLTAFTVAKAWLEQYFTEHDARWHNVYLGNGKTSKQVYDQIMAQANVDPDNLDAVDETIGNKCWTRSTCSNCMSEFREPLVLLDFNESGYNHKLCESCVKKALKLFEGKSK